MREIIFPERIVVSENATNQDNLLKKQPLQIGLNEQYTASFSSRGYVVLDFGQELCASIRLLTFASKNSTVRIRLGESLTECSSEIGEKNATNAHAVRDFTTFLPSYSDMTFQQSGFRFVRIDFNNDVTLKSVVAVSEILKRPAKYVYNGSDPLINKIFNTAKRTVDLCVSSGYVWDGIKRDRLVWIGDMHPEMLALTAMYEKIPEIERSLDFVRKQTPLPGWMNNFPTYSMWWIIILADYYEKTNASAFISRQIKYLEKLVSQISDHVKEDGTLAYPSLFVDWPTRSTAQEEPGSRAINIIAIKKAIFILSRFNKETDIAKDVLRRLQKVEIECGDKKQVIALKHLAVGINDEEKARLICGGAKGMSTFMSYYILKAIASFDRVKAVEIMREYYGAMLDKGATTFFEDFDIEWAKNSCRLDEMPSDGQKDIHGDFGSYCYTGFRHSLCHGWSAGVIQFIKEECAD